LVLLTAAGLVTRTFLRVTSIQTGFEPDRLVEVELRLPESSYSEPRAAVFFEQLLTKVRGLPGVTSASFVHGSPFGRSYTFTTTDSAGNHSPPIDGVEAGADYFRTIGATIREGRGIEANDRPGGENVVVINEILARRLFPQGGAVGRTMQLQGSTVRVIGIVKNVLQRQLEVQPSAVVYRSIAQEGIGRYVDLMVRTEGSPATLHPSIVRAVQSLDPSLPPPPIRLMADVVAREIAPRQFTFVLFGIFAALAGALAVIGLYGVLANLVADRAREIGIRVALGADPRRVIRLILGQGAALATIGVALGLAGSALSVRSARTLLYGTSVYDPWAFAGGATLLVFVSLVAAYLPARRASQVDPVIALRAE
ncbi:MAG TPA: FtsX-like permease family protein, partial [Gemmatimonadaceae bacterium]